MFNVTVAVSTGQAQQAPVSAGSPQPPLPQLEPVPHWSCRLLQSSLHSLQAAPGPSLGAFTASSDLCSLGSCLRLQAPASPPHRAASATTAQLSPTAVSPRSSALLPPCQVLPLTSPSTLRALLSSFTFSSFMLLLSQMSSVCSPRHDSRDWHRSHTPPSSTLAPGWAGFSHHISLGCRCAYVELGLSSTDLTRFCSVTHPINHRIFERQQAVQGLGSALCSV